MIFYYWLVCSCTSYYCPIDFCRQFAGLVWLVREVGREPSDKERNKLGLNWFKLSLSWDWALVQLTCIKLMKQAGADLGQAQLKLGLDFHRFRFDFSAFSLIDLVWYKFDLYCVYYLGCFGAYPSLLYGCTGRWSKSVGFVVLYFPEVNMGDVLLC